MINHLISIYNFRYQCQQWLEFITSFIYSFIYLFQGEDKENVEYTEDGIPTFRDGVEAVNIEPYLRKTAGKKGQTLIHVLFAVLLISMHTTMKK